MRSKLKLSILIALMFVLPLLFLSKTNAFKIDAEGKYTLLMETKEGGEIDGERQKVIRFDLDNDTEAVKLSDLTKGILPFYQGYQFLGWSSTRNDKDDIFAEGTTFTAKDFSSSKKIYAIFSDEKMKGTGTYYVVLDAFGGNIQGKNTLMLTSKADEFKTINLSKYTAERNECDFCNCWGYDGKIVTSIDKSYFKECDAIKVSALYESQKFYGVDENGNINDPNLPEDNRRISYVLTLNANGGTISGQEYKKYDYLTNEVDDPMPIFHYIPQRTGYKFKEWNTTQDGTGKYCKYMYRCDWTHDDNPSGFEKDVLIENKGRYANITLYAIWEKSSNETTNDDVKIISSSSEIKGSAEFENAVDKNYELDIREIEVSDELKNQNVRFMVDINVVNGESIVQINGIKMKIKIALPENLIGYDKYQIVYIENGEIKETLPASIEDGYIIFETNHLSQYGIIATKEEEALQESNENSSSAVTNNPSTGDDITLALTLFATSSVGLSALPIINKKKLK